MHRGIAYAALLSVALVPACSSSGGSSPNGTAGNSMNPGGSAPTRATITCTDALNNSALAGGATASPGDWGSTPTGLQKLPSGGTFCGSLKSTNISGQPISVETLVLTNLWGQALFDFYSPLLTQIGCTAMPPDAHSEIDFTCTSGSLGLIVADPAYQFADISYLTQ